LRSHYIRRPLGFFPKAAATPCSHPLGFSPSALPRNRGRRSKGRSRGKGERRVEHHRVVAIQGQPDVVILEPLRPAGPRPHRQGQRHRSTASRQGVQRRRQAEDAHGRQHRAGAVAGSTEYIDDREFGFEEAQLGIDA
jgi:hypothetical protein